MIREHIEYRNNELLFNNYNLNNLNLKTPFYIYDENRIRHNFKKVLNTFQQYNNNFKLLYAVKANSNLFIAKILQEEGAEADCSSATEILFAKEAGFNLKQSMFTGTSITDEDLQVAKENKIIINLDSIEKINEVDSEIISFRINLDLDHGAFDRIKTGKKDAKFGIPRDQAIEAYRKAKQQGIKKYGIHCMSGSCEIDCSKFQDVVKQIMDLVGSIKQELDLDFEFVNFGGGLSIPYYCNERQLDLNRTAKLMMEEFNSKCKEYKTYPIPMMEPGRYFVGDAGLVITKVTSTKINGGIKFVGVDASMSTLLRPALYNAHHDIFPLKINLKEKEEVTIVGPVCESTDRFMENSYFHKVIKGDYIAILDTGAYGFAMSSNYNGRLKPAEYLISNNEIKLIRKPETFEDYIKNQNNLS